MNLKANFKNDLVCSQHFERDDECDYCWIKKFLTESYLFIELGNQVQPR